MNIIDELKWRGAINQQTDAEGLYKLVDEKSISLYCGIDPTGDSMHIGHLIPFMILKRFQLAGHHPVILIGGGTGAIGDPSGRTTERVLQTAEQVKHNADSLTAQMKKLFGEDGSFTMMNNYDWLSKISLLDFLRDYGKLFNINTMLAKDVVASRLETGISFTEFSYQILQSIDYKMLYEKCGVQLQIGGADQWGNITTGTELIRRKVGGKAFALTCPLITKADGTKFGKSEGGNVWLDPEKTSPYKFYQYWINTSDADAERYIKIFTMLPKEEIEALTAAHHEAPHLRILQNKLAEELTLLVHGKEEWEKAVQASQILFGNSTSEDLKKLDPKTFLEVFDGVPQAEISLADLHNGLDLIAALSAKTGFIKSNSEARRAIGENSIAVNKEKVSDGYLLGEKDLINERFILLQRGKKNYFLIIVNK